MWAWNVRVFKLANNLGYGIKETYYGEEGNIKYYDENNMIYGETLEELKEYVDWINEALKKEIIDEEKVFKKE